MAVFEPHNQADNFFRSFYDARRAGQLDQLAARQERASVIEERAATNKLADEAEKHTALGLKMVMGAPEEYREPLYARFRGEHERRFGLDGDEPTTWAEMAPNAQSLIDVYKGGHPGEVKVAGNSAFQLDPLGDAPKMIGKWGVDRPIKDVSGRWGTIADGTFKPIPGQAEAAPKGFDDLIEVDDGAGGKRWERKSTVLQSLGGAAPSAGGSAGELPPPPGGDGFRPPQIAPNNTRPKPPQDYQWKEDGSGVEPIPGSPAAQQMNKATALKQKVKQIATELLRDPESVRRAVGTIDSQYLPTIRSGTADAETKLETLRSMLTADNLGMLKGTLSDTDMKVISNIAAGGLNERGSDEAVMTALQSLAGIGQDGTALSAPSVGAIEDGHRYLGGNPADPSSWEAIK